MDPLLPNRSDPTRMECISFGDPVSGLDSGALFDYIECYDNGRWYDNPVSQNGLARIIRSSVYLQSGLTFKRNLLSGTYRPHPWLPKRMFDQFVLDFLSFGNAYLEVKRNRLGQPIACQTALAKYMRCGKDNQYYFVQPWTNEFAFAAGTVFQLREPDINQEIYGLPSWFAALQSALLNESATLFRRKYYLNGSHAGFILYINDQLHDEESIEGIRQQMKSSKGIGNFKNMFIYAPGGKDKGLQLIPVGEAATKDEFLSIKNITRDDQLAVLRIPPQLMGIVPHNAAGFGSIRDAAMIFFANEIAPIQETLLQVNEWLGEEVMRFKEFTLPSNG